MSGVNRDISSSLGPLPSDPTVFAGNVTTAVAAATLPAAAATAFAGIVRVKITNLSTTARVAWRLAPRGTAAGSVALSADVTSVNCGVIIAPGASEYFSFPASLALYVVATASAPVCVSTVLV